MSCQAVSDSCAPKDCGLPGSFVHGILQSRILEWVAIPFSRRIFPTQGSNLGFPALQADSLLSEPPGKPLRHRGILIIIIIKLIMLRNHPNASIITRMVDTTNRTCCYDAERGCLILGRSGKALLKRGHFC